MSKSFKCKILNNVSPYLCMKDRITGICITLFSFLILGTVNYYLFAPSSYEAFFTGVTSNAGFFGGIWVILLPIAAPIILRPFDLPLINSIPFSDDITTMNPIGSNFFFFTTIFVICISCFLGGIGGSSGWGGLKVARDSLFIFMVLFSLLTGFLSDDFLWIGIDWFVVAILSFLLLSIFGGMIIIGFLAIGSGVLGGFVGKLSLDSLEQMPSRAKDTINQRFKKSDNKENGSNLDSNESKKSSKDTDTVVDEDVEADEDMEEDKDKDMFQEFKK